MHWSWWVSGLALATVMVVHWLTTSRLMAVSGRFTSLVNRVRFGPSETPVMSEAELIAAIQAATQQEFGELVPDDELDVGGPEPDAHDPLATNVSSTHCGDTSPVVSSSSLGPIAMAPRSYTNHIVFLAAIVVGGFIAAVTNGRFSPTASLRSAHFEELTGAYWPIWLLVGGVLVGFGTRMAGGCTSGHGLCGVSRWQKGSLVATGCFFAAGIGASFLLKLV